MTAKEKMVADIEDRVGEYLTAKQTKQVVADVRTVTETYIISTVATGEVNTELLTMFLNAKRVEGRSEKTINRYAYILERMIREIGEPVERIDTQDIRAYLTELKDRGLMDSSIEGVRSVMSAFFKWLFNEELIRRNPLGNIGTIKTPKKIRMPYSQVEIEKLKEACTKQRDKALICFLLATGARVGEVCKLSRKDVDFQKLECTVLGKGNKERTVHINEVAAMELMRYISARIASGDKSPALFRGDKTETLTEQGVRYILKELSKKTGIQNVHPHRFRRTLATNLINHGMPIQEVAMILGHDDINTTMKYICVDKRNVKNSYHKYM